MPVATYPWPRHPPLPPSESLPMYPLIRMAKEMILSHRAPRQDPLAGHVSRHLCWPWDVDPWRELNNGRTLTLYDLGRIALDRRNGIERVLRERNWGLSVAGASVRYRRRVRMFDRITMHTRLVGWDSRFFYKVQSMWVRGECASQVLIRSAATQGARGIVDPAEVVAALGLGRESPPLPGWVAAWIEAEGARPWPPRD